MKKIIAFIFCFMLAFSACACTNILNADLKEYTAEDFSIMLPDEFEKEDKYTVSFRKNDVFVWVIRDHFSNLDGSEEWSAADYADAIYKVNIGKSPSMSENEGLHIMEYTVFNEHENKTYTYFTTMYKGSDSFWMVQFVCEDKEYETYKPHFTKWAKTVKVG